MLKYYIEYLLHSTMQTSMVWDDLPDSDVTYQWWWSWASNSACWSGPWCINSSKNEQVNEGTKKQRITLVNTHMWTNEKYWNFRLWTYMKVDGIMCSKGICGWVLINSLDVTFPSIVRQPLIIIIIIIDQQYWLLILTSVSWYIWVSRHSANYRPIDDRGWARCQSSVNLVLSEYQMIYWSRCQRSADRRYISTFDCGCL